MTSTTVIETAKQNNITAETIIFTANEAGVNEFNLVDVLVSRNASTSGDINVDVFIDNGTDVYFLIENRLLSANNSSIRVPIKNNIMNTNDILKARPTTTGDFDVIATIGKRS